MHIRSALAAVAVAGALATSQAPAHAATLDVAIFTNESDVFNDTYKWWADELNKRTQGRVQLKATYSGGLVSMVETYNAVRRGIVPVGYTASSFAAGAIPALALLEAIGGTPNEPDEMLKALDTITAAVADLMRPQGVELLWSQPAYDVGIVCRDKHLKTPADWSGMKVRAAGRWMSQQVSALGASPTAIDPGEQYLALQNRTVDCALAVPNLARSFRLYEVAPKYTLLRQNVNMSYFVMNANTWKQISAADQAIVRETSKEAARRTAVYMKTAMKTVLDQMKQAGADIYQLTDAELKATKERMQQPFAAIENSTGEQGKALAAKLRPFW